MTPGAKGRDKHPAELSGSINRLSDSLAASKELSGVNLSGLAGHVRCMEDHLESVDRRVLHIEQRCQGS